MVVPKIGKVDPGPFIMINKSIESDLKMMNDGLNFSESYKNLKNEERSSMLKVNIKANHNRRYGP